MLLINNSKSGSLTKNELASIFFSGCKTEENIGVESEKLLVYKNSKKAVVYNDIAKVLENFSQNGEEKIYDGENIIGLKADYGTVSIEPGSQIEISLNPLKTLKEIELKLTDFYNRLKEYANQINAQVLDYGIQPYSTYEDIKIIPKKRYEYMTKYLPQKELTPFVMMRETAGIQANFDYKSEDDAIKKLSLALKMSPIISAIYANSPIRCGKNTGYKSFRANSWLNVDEERCGFISKKLFEKEAHFTFNDYVEILLDIPMIFIQRGSNCIEAPITFRDFWLNGYNGLQANLNDWETHLSLFFPDVRLKSYVEIRNHDAQNSAMTFSVPAFWKGIMYNLYAFEEAEKILEKYDYEDFMSLRKDSPILGIDAKLRNLKIADLIEEFFEISNQSLKDFGENEEKYLEPVFEYIKSHKVPADDIIKNYTLGII